MTDNYAADYLFHSIAESGNLQGLRVLLGRVDDERRAQILKRRDHRGFTVLHKAAERGDVEMIACLLDKGADLHARVEGEDPEGWTALHLAAFGDHPAAVEFLVKAGSDVEASDPEGATPLCVTVGCGSLRALQALLENGCAVGCRDGEGFTPLHHAAYNGELEMVLALLGKGADVNARAEDGSTPLDWAVREGCDEVVTLLRGQGGIAGESTPAASP